MSSSVALHPFSERESVTELETDKLVETSCSASSRLHPANSDSLLPTTYIQVTTGAPGLGV